MITNAQKERIKEYLEKNQSQERIAKRLGITRHQVRLVLKQIKNNETKPTVIEHNSLDDYRNEIVAWMEEKNMSAFLIHQRLSSKKVNVSLRTVQRFIKDLKKPEVFVPIHSVSGEEGQVDYGYLGRFTKEGKK